MTDARTPSPSRGYPPLFLLALLLGAAWWLYSVSATIAVRHLHLSETLFPLGVPGATGAIMQLICLLGLADRHLWGLLGYGLITLFLIGQVVMGKSEWLWVVAPLVVTAIGARYARTLRQ